MNINIFFFPKHYTNQMSILDYLCRMYLRKHKYFVYTFYKKGSYGMIYLIGETKDNFTHVIKRLLNRFDNIDICTESGKKYIHNMSIDSSYAKTEYIYEVQNHTLAYLCLRPYVLPITDFFHVGDSYFIIYPRVHNTLHYLISTNNIEHTHQQIIYLHLQSIFERMLCLQIYHNDLKAENILYKINETHTNEIIYDFYIHDWSSATILLSKKLRASISQRVPSTCFLLVDDATQVKYMKHIQKSNTKFLKNKTNPDAERVLAKYIKERIIQYKNNVSLFLRFIMLLSICMLLDSSGNSQRFFSTCECFPDVVCLYAEIFNIVRGNKLRFYQGWTHIFIAHQTFMHNYVLSTFI
jgi:hypothetical protein